LDINKEKRKELMEYIQKLQSEALELENQGKFNWYWFCDSSYALLWKVVEVFDS